MYNDVGAQAAAILKAAEQSAVLPVLPHSLRVRPTIHIAAPIIQPASWVNTNIPEPLLRQPIVHGSALPLREPSLPVSLTKRPWATAFRPAEHAHFVPGSLATPWAPSFGEPMQAGTSNGFQPPTAHTIGTLAPAFMPAPLSPTIVQLLGILQAANVKPEDLLYVQQLQQIEQLRSSGLLTMDKLAAATAASYASGMSAGEVPALTITSNALANIPLSSPWPPTVLPPPSHTRAAVEPLVKPSSLLGSCLKAEDAPAGNTIKLRQEKVPAFEPYQHQASEDKPVPAANPVIKTVCSHLPPELQARLRKKIKIIQPISQNWEAEALQQPADIVPSCPPPTLSVPLLSMIQQKSYSTSFQPAPLLEQKPAVASLQDAGIVENPSPPRSGSQTRTTSRGKSHRRTNSPPESKGNLNVSSGTASGKRERLAAVSSPSAVPSEPSGSIYTAAGITSSGGPTRSPKSQLPQPSTSAGVCKPVAPPDNMLSSQQPAGPLPWVVPSTIGFPVNGLKLPLHPVVTAPAVPVDPNLPATSQGIGGTGPAVSGGTVLDQVRGQLSVLHQWYHTNKSVYLEQAEQMLKVLEKHPSGSRASAGGKIDNASVLRAFEKAIQIMQASSEVEQQWRNGTCAQQAVYVQQAQEVKPAAAPEVPRGPSTQQ